MKRYIFLIGGFIVFSLVFGFVIFTFDDMGALGSYLSSMFGMAGNPLLGMEVLWYLGNYSVVLLVACILAFPVYPWLKTKMETSKKAVADAVSVISLVGFVALFLLSTAYLVNDTYNPFLYFRF